MTTVPTNKNQLNTFETYVHAGFEESLSRCAGKNADFDTPEFVECIKASAVNYGRIATRWQSFTKAFIDNEMTGNKRAKIY